MQLFYDKVTSVSERMSAILLSVFSTYYLPEELHIVNELCINAKRVSILLGIIFSNKIFRVNEKKTWDNFVTNSVSCYALGVSCFYRPFVFTLFTILIWICFLCESKRHQCFFFQSKALVEYLTLSCNICTRSTLE